MSFKRSAGSGGELTARVRQVSEPEACEGGTLSNATITPRQGGDEVWVEFIGCVPAALLREQDFRPAELYRPPPPPKRMPASTRVKKQP